MSMKDCGHFTKFVYYNTNFVTFYKISYILQIQLHFTNFVKFYNKNEQLMPPQTCCNTTHKCNFMSTRLSQSLIVGFWESLTIGADFTQLS